VEVDERVTLVGYTSDPKHAQNAIKWSPDGTVTQPYSGDGIQSGLGDGDKDVRRGLSGEAVHVIKTVDEDAVRTDLAALFAKGYRSIAVVLAHS